MYAENLVIYNKTSQISKKHNICCENILYLKVNYLKKNLETPMFYVIGKLTKM